MTYYIMETKQYKIENSTKHLYNLKIGKLKRYPWFTKRNIAKPNTIYNLIYDNITRNDGTIKTYLSAILYYVENENLAKKCDVLGYRSLIKQIRLNESKRDKDNVLSEKQNNFVTYKQLQSMKSELGKMTKKQPELLKFYTVMSLYVDLIPRRVLDYSCMLFYNKMPKQLNKKHNYLILSEKKFIFLNYKTKKTYGEQVIDISQRVVNLLQRYIKQYDIKEGDSLFNLSQSGFSQYIIYHMKKTFDISQFSMNSFRHIYVTSLFNKKLSVNDREKIALYMSHSLITSLLYSKHM